MMQDWHPDMKRKLRREILRILSTTHAQQKSRLDDLAICHLLRQIAWDVDMNDIVTILQDMCGRGWVKYRQLRNVYMRRVQLLEVEILPLGQDVYDQVVSDPAMEV
jgi:hypothetical protein